MMTPEPAEFHVSGERHGAAALVVLSGELDIATVPRLAATIEELRAGNGLRQLVLDLRGLAFLDSMSLELLLQLHADLTAAGGELLLVRGPRAVNRLFEVMELDKVLVLVDEPPAALRPS